MLRQRALTALLLVGAFVGFVIFGGQTGLILWCWLFALGTILEYCLVLMSGEPLSFRWLVFLLTLNIYIPNSVLDPIWTLSLGFLGLVTYVVGFSQRDIEGRIKQLGFGFISLFYVGFLTKTVTQGCSEYGLSFLLALFLVSFGTDTFAYFGGRFLGRTPLSPSISPNKTREGALAGLVFGSLLSTLYYVSQHGFNPLLSFVLFALASVSSQTGDIFESLLKRAVGKKDSSQILPGHGGLLDRLDGLLFASPIVYGLFSLAPMAQ